MFNGTLRGALPAAGDEPTMPVALVLCVGPAAGTYGTDFASTIAMKRLCERHAPRCGATLTAVRPGAGVAATPTWPACPHRRVALCDHVSTASAAARPRSAPAHGARRSSGYEPRTRLPARRETTRRPAPPPPRERAAGTGGCGSETPYVALACAWLRPGSMATKVDHRTTSEVGVGRIDGGGA